ncbi:MAG: HAMP domain-containing protein [Candidatus Riflebacteria bacterium]|nr:HAMP domain-containing protein [Candidatus Riflebacteria bacterium]
MDRTRENFWQLTFLLLLSLLPFGIIWGDGRLRQEFALEQKRLDWEQEAERLIEEIRANLTLESQLARMGLRLARQFGRITDPSWRLTAPELVARFRACFPAAHRPAGVRLYGFGRDARGGLTLLSGPGLENNLGQMVKTVFTWVLAPPATRGPVTASLTKKFQAMFGDYVPLDLVTNHRRGQATPVFAGREDALLLWDHVETQRGKAGGYLAIFPLMLRGSDIPAAHALREARQRHRGMLPVLLPMEGEPASRAVILPDGYRPSRRAARLLRRLRPLGKQDRDRLAEPGNVFTIAGNHWAMRQFLAPDVPFEIWVFSPIPRTWWEGTTASLLLWGMVAGGFWAFLGVRLTGSGGGFSLSMRQWVMICMVFLAALALAILRFSALYYVETATARQVHDRVANALARLEGVDTGVTAVFDQYEQACARLAFDRRWVMDLLGDDAAVASRAAALAEAFLARQRPPISLRYVVRFQARQNLAGRTFPQGAADPVQGASLQLFLQPFMEAGAQMAGFLPQASGAERKGREVIERMFTDLIRFSMNEGAFRMFLNFRQRADLMQNGEGTLLQYYDFLARAGRLLGGVVFLADAPQAYEQYLRLAIPRMSASDPSWFVIGRRLPTGCQVIHPPAGSLLNSRDGQLLEELMHLSALSNAAQEERGDGVARVAHTCRFADGFVLGALVPLHDIQAWRDRQLRLLEAAIVGFLGLVFLLSRATANHLLDPLGKVEEGLRRVAGGDLDLRLDLQRQDELGDLSATFDGMLQGLRERRDLGRFVSGEVDALVARADLGTVLAPQRRLGTVLVSDLRQFTTLSETHPAAKIVAMLNRHHQEMVEAIRAEGGSIELFIGDAVVAAFYDHEEGDAPRRAVAAALEMRRRHAGILAERREAGRFVYQMGVGIDRGEVLAGTFGEAGRLEHTLLGPPRQRAERLEAMSKKGSHTLIVVSPAVARLCPATPFAPLSSEALEVVGPDPEVRS